MAKYAIIGFGCAGYYGARAIRESDATGEIVVYSEHPAPPYNPMLTTYYVAGKIPYDAQFPFGDMDKITKELNLTVHTGTKVVKVNGGEKSVQLADGTTECYDKILVATGARAFAPDIPGLEKADAFYMRTLDDAVRLRTALETNTYQSALVVGASMVGIKVVELLNKAGIDTTLADMADRIFSLAAYENVSREIEKRIGAKGVKLALGSALSSCEKTEDGYLCTMTDGTEIRTQLIVLCIGTRATTDLVDSAEIKVNRGIVVNEEMETSCAGIYAAGDCCEGNELQTGENMIIGLWANAAYQGMTAGANMAGSAAQFDGNFMHNITHFMGMDFIGFGDNRKQGRVITSGNIDSGLYVEAVIGEEGLLGVNILDNYRISGAVKNYLYRLMSEGKVEISPIQRGVLIKEGLRPSFIEKLEGSYNG